MIDGYNDNFSTTDRPNMWTERQLTLTDNCIKKIVDEVVKRLNDKDKIVRCKDCKYMFINEGKTTKFYFCDEFEISVDETDYCAWGEKKDEID